MSFKFTLSYDNVFRKKQEKQLQQKNKNKKKAQKSVQIRSYPWSVFFGIRSEHGNLRSKSANSVRMQEIWIKITPYLDTFRAVYASGRVEFFLNDTAWLYDL